MIYQHVFVSVRIGARIKIGYQIALKLLRCGATVLATTRFPHLARARFLAEHDSHTYMSRLHIYGIDFRNLIAVQFFLKFVKNHFKRVDIVINNAAQTVRR